MDLDHFIIAPFCLVDDLMVAILGHRRLRLLLATLPSLLPCPQATPPHHLRPSGGQSVPSQGAHVAAAAPTDRLRALVAAGGQLPPPRLSVRASSLLPMFRGRGGFRLRHVCCARPSTAFVSTSWWPGPGPSCASASPQPMSMKRPSCPSWSTPDRVSSWGTATTGIPRSERHWHRRACSYRPPTRKPSRTPGPDAVPSSAACGTGSTRSSVNSWTVTSSSTSGRETCGI